MTSWRNYKPEQPNLLGINRADHSNLGKAFEEELEFMHKQYRREGAVDVVQNPNSWEFARGEHWHFYKKLFHQKDHKAALTGDGRPLMRVYSEVDFSGGNGEQSFCFDAKMTKGSRFPFDSIKPLQVTRLKESARCGTCAGVMIQFYEHRRVFFISIEKFAPKYDAWYKTSDLRGVRAKPGTASLSIEECEQIGVEVFRRGNSDYWDWYAVLRRNK